MKQRLKQLHWPRPLPGIHQGHQRARRPAKGIWCHVYVIIDIFSRYIVGHTVELAESADRAEELIRETIDRNGIVPETVHAAAHR
ncbi:transposase family protein [Streptomyces sp. NPDC057596]|uniref:integrase catalytic domain-containing protein n=1 Tax=Streptomyces sp. NPDC057596 TaxID=3346178 RepID=UPI00369C26C3